jgi:hypothetical protein
MDQFTVALVVPVSVALMVVDCPPVNDAVVGETEIATGVSEMLALAVLVVSAALVALTVTVWAEAIVAGAVYTPLDNVPTDGDMDQVTLVLVDPVTLAFKVVDCPPVREAEAGVMVIATVAEGFKETDACAFFVGSAALIAVTVTVCAVVTVAGAA